MGHHSSHINKHDFQIVTHDDSKSKLSYGLAAMKGWRKFMEDAYLTIMNFHDNPNLDLFAVFDGHGGSQVAIFVKQQFPRQLAKNQHFLRGNYPDALRQTFEKMDQLLQTDYGMRKLEIIIDQQDKKGNNKNMLFGQSMAGCTALVCLVTKDKIYIANAGDSKAIAYVSKQCIALNIEHKPSLTSQLMRIRLAGGYVQQGRIMGNINISRCIGDFEYKKNLNKPKNEQMIICEPQIVEVSRQNCQYILLGSDGIWQSKTNQEMHKWFLNLPNNLKLSQKLQLLLNNQVSKTQDSYDGKDNMTAILIQFT